MSAPTAEHTAAGITWDLSALFNSPQDPKIETTWKTSHEKANEFSEKYRDKVATLTAPQLAQALAELEDIINEVTKPGSYAGLLFYADTSNPELGAFYQTQSEKTSSIRVKLMFFDLELQQIDQQQINTLIQDPSLHNYAHHIYNIRKYTPHTLSEKEEVLLEQVSNTGSRAWVRLHEEILSNHTFHYTNPTTDESEELDQSEVLDKLRDPDRKVRSAAAQAFTRGLQELNRVICFTYNTLLADKKLEDELRGYEDAETSRHMANELDKSTVDIVVNLCKERADLVERYYKVKKEILNLPELTEVDRYAPLFEAEAKVSWEEAKTTVLNAFRDFSPRMADVTQEFFDNNWIDAEPRKGKGGGAFCNYNTPDTHSVVFMTYLGNVNDVMTLAHELGHGVHGNLSRAQTPFNFQGTLPLAELASIFGEMLVFESVTKTATPKDNLALHAEKIEGIFASVHRQAAMFRFEQKCHEHRRTHGELSSEQFGEYWQQEMQQMFGSSVTLGDQHKDWWSYVGHFFFAPFYVYAYSFGELLTLSLYQKAKSEGPAFADKYLDVLALGGAQSPHQLMSHLGVDLKSKEFWEGGFQAIDSLVKKFEQLYQESK